MAIAIAAASSSSRRRRNKRKWRKKKKNPSNRRRRRYEAAISHLGWERDRSNIVQFSNEMSKEGIAMINYCRLLHQYSATYNKHDTILTRNILPPNNHNFHFIPYSIDSKNWQDGQNEKMLSPFGEIDIKTPVTYPTSFIGRFSKKAFIEIMTLIHTHMITYDHELNKELILHFYEKYPYCRCCCPVKCFLPNLSERNESKRQYLSDMIDDEINNRTLFINQGMTLNYIYCGKLEGLILSISPWLNNINEDDRLNNAWIGTRPDRILLSNVISGSGGSGGSGSDMVVAAVVSKDAIIESKYLCDTPTIAGKDGAV
jgi:hypothetical protein